jgi:hypothetical protein
LLRFRSLGAGAKTEVLTRSALALALQTAIGNSSIDKIRYSITEWEITWPRRNVVAVTQLLCRLKAMDCYREADGRHRQVRVRDAPMADGTVREWL